MRQNSKISGNFTINGGSVSTSWHWRLSGEFPLDPLSILLELVFEQIVFIRQIRIGMNVAGVAAEHEHRVLVHNGRVMIAWCRRLPSGECILPRFILHIETNQIVEHAFAVVAAEYVDRFIVCDDSVFASPILFVNELLSK